MEQITCTLNKTEQPEYANFWTRVKATLLDVLILAPITFGLNYYILIYVKSFLLTLCLSLAMPLYKCFMEKQYGATFGKKIMKICVVSENLERLTFIEVFTRNYCYFLALIQAIIGYYFLYEMPDFKVATTLGEVWELKSDVSILYKAIKYMIVGLFYVDILLMLKNTKKQTLHDRLSKTIVIKI